MLSDNARNTVKAMKECLGCMEQTLQLTVNEADISDLFFVLNFEGSTLLLFNIMTYLTYVSSDKWMDMHENGNRSLFWPNLDPDQDLDPGIF